MRRRIVAELQHTRVPIERGLHDAALHAAAPPVHQPHDLEAGACGGLNVLGDDRRDVPRSERVQIDLAFDRDARGHGWP